MEKEQSTKQTKISTYNNTEARRKCDRREHIFKLAVVGLSNHLGHSFEVIIPIEKGKLKESMINISIYQTSLFDVPRISKQATRKEKNLHNLKIISQKRL